MSLRVYNSMSRSIEPFETVEPGVVRMYVCGVTVYSDAHIGHGMSAITFDVIRRYLEWSGYTVLHANNFTDVDDKIINRAATLGMSPFDLANQLVTTFREEVGALNVLPATFYPRVTEEIPSIIEMIEGLIRLEHAYAVDGDVYYRVTSFPEYGKLSGRKLDDMLAGARMEIDPRKEHPMDFALWKGAKPGEPAWTSPWGEGRPGWHIECSVMAQRHLGHQLDIHGGGSDLIFPHHENEIAQSEAFPENRPFARYWMHNGMLQFAGEKMSKSVGNLVPLRELIERGDTRTFRLMVLQSVYRSPLTFSDEGLEANRRALTRLEGALRDYDANAIAVDAVRSAAIEDIYTRFRTAMDDDFNTPVAVSLLFELARSANRAAGAERAALQHALVDLAGVLGLDLSGAADDTTADAGDAAPFIDLLLDIRNELRTAKQWALADRIRDDLAARGIVVEDTATGAGWHRERS